MWYDDIYKLGIQALDYGDNFSNTEKYEYNILTFDKKNKTDTIPGMFKSKQKIRAHIKILVKEITEKSGHNCSIDKKIYSIAVKNSEKHKILDERLRRIHEKKRRERSEIKRQNIYNNYNPGGARDHSER